MSILRLDDVVPRLKRAHSERRLIPFLGAGFSVPLGLPRWDELVGWMAEAVGFHPDLFELHGTAPQLAGYFDLAHPQKLHWFIDQMKARFHSGEAEARREQSNQHRALAHCDFRAIYTTNFERHIERALTQYGKPVRTVARDQDFVEHVPPDTCAVYKFHGDLEHPKTIVLAESHFFDRLALDAAPDLRLHADLLTNVFLFIGYSFSDTNIRYVWHRMDRMRRRAGITTDDRSYWVSFGADPVQPKLLAQWNIDVIELDGLDKTQSIVDLLTPLHLGATP